MEKLKSIFNTENYKEIITRLKNKGDILEKLVVEMEVQKLTSGTQSGDVKSLHKALTSSVFDSENTTLFMYELEIEGILDYISERNILNGDIPREIALGFYQDTMLTLTNYIIQIIDKIDVIWDLSEDQIEDISKVTVTIYQNEFRMLKGRKQQSILLIIAIQQRLEEPRILHYPIQHLPEVDKSESMIRVLGITAKRLQKIVDINYLAYKTAIMTEDVTLQLWNADFKNILIGIKLVLSDYQKIKDSAKNRFRSKVLRRKPPKANNLLMNSIQKEAPLSTASMIASSILIPPGVQLPKKRSRIGSNSIISTEPFLESDRSTDFDRKASKIISPFLIINDNQREDDTGRDVSREGFGSNLMEFYNSQILSRLVVNVDASNSPKKIRDKKQSLRMLDTEYEEVIIDLFNTNAVDPEDLPEEPDQNSSYRGIEKEDAGFGLEGTNVKKTSEYDEVFTTFKHLVTGICDVQKITNRCIPRKFNSLL